MIKAPTEDHLRVSFFVWLSNLKTFNFNLFLKHFSRISIYIVASSVLGKPQIRIPKLISRVAL